MGKQVEAPVKVNVDTEKFICTNCGGVMKYDIGSQAFRCSSCRAESSIEALSDKVLEYDFSQYAEREKNSVPFEGMAVVHCQNCGCEITFEELQIATTCPMCSSTQVATIKQSSGIPPEGIVPFKIDKNEAKLKFRGWAKSRWFAPNDFKKKFSEGSLNGMYLPYWTYDASAIANYTGRGGTTRIKRDKDGKTTTEIDWTFVSGVVSASFDDIQVCASKKAKDINGILPFNTVQNTKPYSPSYLSGFYAELYTIKADAAFESAKDIMESELRSLSAQDIRRRYAHAEVHSLRPRYSSVTYKHLLLPVWGSAYGYKGKTYNYFVNGETGKVDGQRPYSIPKIVIAVISAIIMIAAVVFLFNKYEGTSEYSNAPVVAQEAKLLTASHDNIEQIGFGIDLLVTKI